MPEAHSAGVLFCPRSAFLLRIFLSLRGLPYRRSFPSTPLAVDSSPPTDSLPPFVLRRHFRRSFENVLSFRFSCHHDPPSHRLRALFPYKVGSQGPVSRISLALNLTRNVKVDSLGPGGWLAPVPASSVCQASPPSLFSFSFYLSLFLI